MWIETEENEFINLAMIHRIKIVPLDNQWCVEMEDAPRGGAKEGFGQAASKSNIVVRKFNTKQEAEELMTTINYAMKERLIRTKPYEPVSVSTPDFHGGTY